MAISKGRKFIHEVNQLTCFHPLSAYRLLFRKTANGKSVITFNSESVSKDAYENINLPCNQCIGCRIDRSKEWALRCVHEASLFENNCFITLTYNERSMEESGSLKKSDFQKFIKRLRKRHQGIEIVGYKRPIRYFHCGEYGAELSRPHHHACLFNFDFSDKELWSIRQGVRLYRSKSLEKLWPFGYSTVGDVTFQSAAYIARYITKKINGKRAENYYKRVDTDTGEIHTLQPEYITMSRRPGIGRRWFEQFESDVFPKDFITHGGKKFKSPKYYDNIYDATEPDKFRAIKEKRLKKMAEKADNNTQKRLNVRERVLIARNKRQIREYEK